MFLAATAALEVQMSVCLSVTLATAVQDFCRTSERLLKDSKGLLKDFQRTLDFIVYKILTSRSPQVVETCYLVGVSEKLFEKFINVPKVADLNQCSC